MIRDNIQYFRDNPDSYYLLEAMLGTTAGAGTATLSPFMVKNNRQEASISEKPNKTSKLYEAPDGGGGITDRIKIENIEVSFGHGGRHLDGTGVSLLDVNQAIANDVVSKHGGTGQFYKGRINIDGVEIEYTSYGVKDGLINVGTYYPVK